MATVTKPIALDESLNTTEQTPRNIADVLAQELSRITGRTASEVEYDNTDSGLTADNVQDALDEIAESVPTLPTTDIQTAVDEFETYNGGLLSSLKVALSPNQDLHGYDSPWVGGASKQLIPMTVNALKLANAWMTWNGKVATAVGLTVTLLTDDAENVICIDVDGIANVRLDFSLGWVYTDGSYVISGSTNGGLSEWGVWQRGHGSVESEMSLDGAGTFTDTRQTDNECVLTIFQGATPSHQKFYPMLCLSSAPDPTVFAPYTNICPINGHTQADVDVSDGQTTQEQVTVNLGGTYYSGTLDVVTGVFVPDMVEKDVSASDLLNQYLDTTNNQYLAGIDANAKIPATINTVGNVKCNELTAKAQSSLFNEVGDAICILTDGKLRVTFSGVTTFADMQTWVTNHPLQVVYELANPTPIQLSPTMVKALVGENHLSAPLEGQEITESKYKQAFTFDDVNAQIESTYSEGISHNSVYRGKYLGDHVTDEQWDAIGDGSFRDLYIGDYWTINGINWRIAHFNYWLGTGDVKCNTNHVVIVPYGWVSTFNMNASDDTTGGYLNSEWYTTNRHFAVENIEANFGASHILSHRNFFSDAVSDGHASHGMWVDSTVDLMNEIMVCGSLVGSYSGKYYEVGCDKFQLALFKYNPPSARMDVSYWLRGVSTASSFVAMGNFGLLDGFTASQILKIRPVFAIKK